MRLSFQTRLILFCTGTFLLAVIPELVREFGQYRLLFTAGVTLLMLVVRPSGMLTHETVAAISGVFARLIERSKQKRQSAGERPQ